MGRAWPRHRHRGRPLNSVVRSHQMSRHVAIAASISLVTGCTGLTPAPHAPFPEMAGNAATCPKLTPVGTPEVLYPRGAREVGQEGWVHFRFDIAPDGTATNIRMLGSSPKGIFDVSARTAIGRAKFAHAGDKDCEFLYEYRLR